VVAVEVTVLACGCRISPVLEDPDELGYWLEVERCDLHQSEAESRTLRRVAAPLN
jgi:hypothetical protein